MLCDHILSKDKKHGDVSLSFEHFVSLTLLFFGGIPLLIHQLEDDTN